MAVTEDVKTPETVVSGGEEGGTPAPKRGKWLDETDSEKVAKMIHAERDKQKRQRNLWQAKAEVNAARRRGIRGVRLIKENDRSVDYAKVYIPRGATAMAAPANNTDKLCRRVTSTLTVDPPEPYCEPSSGSNEDREAAECSTRVLRIEGSPTGFNAHGIIEKAVDRGMTWGSDFTYVCVDPQGGGWKPVQVKAAPDAISVTPDPRISPMSGEVAVDTVLKYVLEDGSLSDDATGAAKRWLPRVKIEHLHPIHVSLLPEWSEGIEPADGVILCIPTTLGSLRSRYTDVIDGLSDERLAEAVAWRPEKWEAYVPGFCKPSTSETDRKKRPEDSELCFPLYTYYKSCFGYPEGAYICILGEKETLHRDTWMGDLPKDAKGTTEPAPLDIPLAQWRCLPDYDSGDPMGEGLASKLGPYDEVAHNLWGYTLDWSFKAGNPNVFVPHSSPIQAGALGRRDGTPIPYLAATGNPIVYEDIPDLPQMILELLKFIETRQNSESGLEQAAQGVEDPSVKSGVHARTIIEQALVSLSAQKRGLADGYVRTMRIVLQQIRAFYDGSQVLRYIGEDGDYKQEEWDRSDLGSTTDVSIARGTNTLMTPTLKNQFATEMLQLSAQTKMPILDVAEYRRIINHNMNPVIGSQDNPHLQRVRGQITRWRNGPPEEGPSQESVAQAAQQDQMGQQQFITAAQQAQAAGMPFQGQPPQPIDPTTVQAAGIFQPLPVDMEPTVALLRHGELASFMATHDYARQPPPWQAGFNQAYEQARQAAMPAAPHLMTAQEQQQMAAQQQAQAEAQKQEQGAEKREEREAKAGSASDLQAQKDSAADRRQAAKTPA